jgi:hypothetical protein
MAFCPNCGSPLKEQQSFCQSCGSDVRSLSAPAAPSVPVQPGFPAASENVRYILPEIKYILNNQLHPDYTLLVTDQRLIFARLTEQVRQDAYRMSQANDQGKGFWGKWKSQVSGHNWLIDRYQAVTPQQALSESPENFVVYHSAVRLLKIKYYSGDEDGNSEYYFYLQTDAQLIKFHTVRNYEKEFEMTYGKLVKKE